MLSILSKLKSLNIWKNCFFHKRIPLPPIKTLQYIQFPFRVSISRAEKVGGKKFETSAGIEWFTSNVNHFFSRHAVRHDSAWISWKRFVSRSFHLARWISNTSPSYQLFTPLFLAKAETPPFFRAEEFISWRTFSFVLPFYRVIARPRGGEEEENRFRRKTLNIYR